MPVQSVRFSIRQSTGSVNGGRGWTEGAARRWLRGQNLRAPRARRTTNQLRFRQIEPDECREDSFRVLGEAEAPRGVQLLECELA